MVETIKNGKWLWYDMQADLEKAGAVGVTVTPLNIKKHLSGGYYKNEPWTLSWIQGQIAMLSVPEYDENAQKLSHAFAKVFEYEPFCRYVHTQTNLITIEWDKIEADKRFANIQNDSAIKYVVRLY